MDAQKADSDIIFNEITLYLKGKISLSLELPDHQCGV